MEHSHTAGQFGQTFLKFLLVVVGCGIGDLGLDLGHTGCDSVGRACTVHDSSILLVYGNLLSTAEHVDGGTFELHALLLADNHTSGQSGNVFKHLLAAVAESGSLHCTDLQRSAETVHYQSSKSLAVNVFSDDQQRTSALCGSFKNGKHILKAGYLLVEEKDKRRVHLTLHLLGVGDEIR